MTISLEFFPPKTQVGFDNLERTLESYLMDTPISYVSVTYGANGSEVDNTLRTINTFVDYNGPDVYAHLTTVGQTYDSLGATLMMYKDIGVRGIVALRGDNPDGKSVIPVYELIQMATSLGFDVKAAGYPELHPDSTTLNESLSYDRKKLELGASALITQICFNNDAIIDYTNELVQEDSPYHFGHVIPGILPIRDYDQVKRFVDRCGAELPRWIRNKLEHSNNVQEVANQIFSNQLATLSSEGFSHFHIYTLNKPLPTSIREVL